MRYIVKTNNRSVDIPMTIMVDSNSPNKILKTVVLNPENGDLISERYDLLENFQNSKREVILKLPITAEKLVIETFGDSTGRKGMFKDKSFSTTLAPPQALRTYNLEFGSGDLEFLSFIEKIAKDLPNINPSDVILKSPSGNFGIVVFDRLRSRDGDYISSPAMIHIKTGLIEISKEHFMKMSINQRIATLSHEYAHFYKNPLVGLDVKDEYGADLHGITVYLSRGYGESEYLEAFRKTFNGHATQQNKARWLLIKDFAKKIHEGKYFGKPYNL
jgi:hypothetical protein